MPRVVRDTNVLVSAVISEGRSRALLNRGIENRFTIVTSDYILRELVSVLRRPKFKTSDDEIRRIVLALMQTGEVVRVRSNFRAVKGDPKDDAILSTAYEGRADTIVTGDGHLLKLGNFKGIKILTVSEAIHRF